MNTIPIEEASSRLSEIIDQLQPGEEIELTRGSETVARLVKSSTQNRSRQFGLGKGKLTILADDDEHLEHFQDYSPDTDPSLYLIKAKDRCGEDL